MSVLPTLNFRRRINLLVWTKRLSLLGGLLAAFVLFASGRFGWAVALLVVTVLLNGALKSWQMSVRRQFIREAEFPPFIVRKLMAAFPQLRRGDADLVLRGLRQFFMAHLRSGRQFVAMPSKVVDEAWHEYILHTRGYQLWCEAAFGGMLHHTPAEVLGNDARRNDGLRRTWYWACKEESIDPRKPSRLPLLFALDAKFDVEGGFKYTPDCSAIDRAAGSDAYCGTGFSDSGGGSGDAGGFGGSESSSSGSGGDSGGGDSGSGCGGGCGGGGGD
ncbi:glycine-rich domain-containing protein [Variovorax rhizosphaerae]